MQRVKIIISIILATIILTAIGIACIDLPPSGVIIYAFDQNPAGFDEGNEWVTFHNLVVHTPLFIGGLTTAKTDNPKKCSWRSSR